MPLDADDRLRLDYDQTTQLLRTLNDIRFKLLAFVPTIAGAAVGLLGRPRPAIELLALGLLGLSATLGIFLYELRNSQLYAAAARRARELERKLALPAADGADGPGGLLTEQPGETIRLLGFLPVAHDRGLALVYGPALAAWSYLVAWGVLRAFDAGGAREVGLAIGAAVGLLLVTQARRVA